MADGSAGRVRVVSAVCGSCGYDWVANSVSIDKDQRTLRQPWYCSRCCPPGRKAGKFVAEYEPYHLAFATEPIDE